MKTTNEDNITKAIKLCIYCMKKQVFVDGNKRSSVILANYFLIKKGGGLLVIPESKVEEFKYLLVLYYKNKDEGKLFNFLKKYCIKKLN